MTGGSDEGTWIAPEATLRGTLTGRGDVHVAGEMRGDLSIDGEVRVAVGGRLRGDARCQTFWLSEGGVMEGRVAFVGRPRAEPVVDAQVHRASATRIGVGVALDGSLETEGDLRVAGETKGALSVAGRLVVEPGAVVAGAVRASALVLRGRLEGEVWTLAEPDIASGAQLLARVHRLESPPEPANPQPRPLPMPRLGRVAARRRGGHA